MRTYITIMVLLFLFSAYALADMIPEEIEALQSKEAAGIQLTPSEKSQLENYLTRQQLRNPWLDTSWGTDGWYSAADQYSGGQAFNWIDISLTGTELWNGLDQDDTWSSPLPLPFTFPYYWLQRDSVKVSANVLLCFDNQTTPSYSLAIPSNTGHMKIDPWTYDMYHHGTDTVGASHYYYQSFGDSLFVVQFYQARYYSTTYRYDETYGKDLEVLLYSDGRIVFQYDSLRNIVAGSPYNSGIEDSVNVNGLTCGNDFSQGQAITFTPLSGVIISNGQVNPPTGNPSTEFVYQVNYRNTASSAPTSAMVYVDDVGYAMVDSTYGAGDYYMGVPYYHTTMLTAGAHNYYFQFEYGGNFYRFPETGYLDGPTVYPPLSGNYDIGGGANDFNTIVEAVDALNGAGLSAAVVFTVYDGIYDGQVEFLNTIPGLSEINTVTVQAATGVRPIVRNTEGSSTTTGNAFRFVGADYITVKGFEIDNCYYTAFNVYYTGSDSSKYITIEDNYIHDIAPSYSGNGIYVYRGVSVNVLNNEIQGDYYGISLSYSSYCLVANNLVYGQDYYGIRNYASTDNNFLYNSVYLNSDYATTNYVSYFYNSTGCVLKNNIFYNGGSGSTSKYAIYISGTLTTYPVTSDYNDLYSPNSSVGYYSGAKTTLADWQIATLLDANSISTEPNFVSVAAPFNLHISTAASSPVDSMGTPVAEVTVDFDYEARDATFPDIGADEFLYAFYEVEVTPETQNNYGMPGATVEYYYNVFNGGNIPEVFNLSTFGAAWTTAIYDSAGTTVITSTSSISAGGSEWVKVNHSVPGNAQGGDWDTGCLVAVASQCPAAADTAAFTTTVPEGMAMVIEPEALADTANTGCTVYYNFYVKNTGSMMDDYMLWSSGAVWEVALYDSAMAPLSSIEDLAAGDSCLVIVAHDIPFEPPDPLSDMGYLGAVSLSMPSVIDSSSFTTLAVVWPPVRIVLIPDTATTVIPAGGGSFLYSAEITNYSGSETYQIRLWNNTVLPNGVSLNLFTANIYFHPGQSFVRDCHQYVPAAAPAGIYTYTYYVANFVTWEVYDSSGFAFEKLAGDEAARHNMGWTVLGWDLESTAENMIPTQYDLHANFPNPFNPDTKLAYDMPEGGMVTLSIYDVTGREVAKLVDSYQAAGRHQAVFNGANLASGVYFAVFKANNFHKTQKMLLVK